MNTPIITMGQEEAKKHYEEYKEVVKTRKEKYLEELKSVYKHLSDGAKIIDIYEVFKTSGVNDNGEPKLGIAPAACREIEFVKFAMGSGTFTPHGKWSRAEKGDVALPSGTFLAWKEIPDPTEYSPDRTEIERKRIKASVPLIPATMLPDSKSLDGYYILFEVAEWNEIPQAKDPYLLKRINENAFVVLAEWDVTDVELAVMRGK